MQRETRPSNLAAPMIAGLTARLVFAGAFRHPLMSIMNDVFHRFGAGKVTQSSISIWEQKVAHHLQQSYENAIRAVSIDVFVKNQTFTQPVLHGATRRGERAELMQLANGAEHVIDATNSVAAEGQLATRFRRSFWFYQQFKNSAYSWDLRAPGARSTLQSTLPLKLKDHLKSSLSLTH